MKVIVCVDQNNGMMFNNRRQSRDRYVVKNIIEYIGSNILRMNGYSAELFKDISGNICVEEQFLDNAGADDYCFVENCHIYDYDIEELILYRWDKKYPSDFKLKIKPEKYTLKSTLEFQGYSHEKIIREVYVRNE